MTQLFPVLHHLGLLLFRVMLAAMLFSGHGIFKIEKILAGQITAFADPIGLGPTASLIAMAFAEGICTLFIIVGLFTRLASLPIVFGMLVAAFIVHSTNTMFPEMLVNVIDNYKVVFTPSKEYPLLYGTGFMLLIFTGAGKFSFDYYIREIILKQTKQTPHEDLKE